MPERLALSCGDPAGVGPELIVRFLEEAPEWRERVCVLGPARWLEQHSLPGQAVGPEAYVPTPGQPSEAGARVALGALEAAAALCRQGACLAVASAPVNKAELARVGFPFPGQTEFFAHRWGGTPTMAFCGEALNLVLATWHVPLAAVPELLRRQPELLERAVARAHALGSVLRGGEGDPRLALCGLNPHAGESGLLGTDEALWLVPRAQALRQSYPGLSEPLPADTVFWQQRQGAFDVSIALYHDQGLGPLKTLEFDRAVNVTLGLPFLRTSPDHGTAYALAGRGTASLTSWRRAVELAWALRHLPAGSAPAQLRP